MVCKLILCSDIICVAGVSLVISRPVIIRTSSLESWFSQSFHEKRGALAQYVFLDPQTRIFGILRSA